MAAGTTAAGGGDSAAEARGAITFNAGEGSRVAPTSRSATRATRRRGGSKIPDYFAPRVLRERRRQRRRHRAGRHRTTPSPSSCTSRPTPTRCSTSSPRRSTTTTPARRSKQTYQDYTDMMNALYQTYGRKVVLKFLDASGTSDNGTAARADAVKAVEELGAFAGVGWSGARAGVDRGDQGPWRHLPRVPGDPRSRRRSSSRSPRAASRAAMQLAEYITKKLADSPRSSPVTRRSSRRPESSVSSSSTRRAARPSRTPLTSRSSSPTAAWTSSQQIPYTLDPARLQEQAAGVIQKLKAGGRHDGDLERRPDRTEDLHRGSDQAELLPGVDLRRVLRSSTRMRSVARTTRSSGPTRSASAALAARVSPDDRQAVRPAHVVLRRPRSGERHVRRALPAAGAVLRRCCRPPGRS